MTTVSEVPNTTTARASARPTTTRMFKSNFFEFFSRVHPSMPFIVWLPVIAVMLYRTHARADLGVAPAVGLFVGGLVVWTLTEYVLHRYVFHWTNDTAFGKRVHFLLHGVHHDYPQDKDRLVMPIGASAPVAVIAYSLFYLAFGGVRMSEVFFAGFSIGYLIYDGSHFAIHHFNFKNSWFRSVKRHHMLHHHADHDGGFGVSSPFWDLVFRSMPNPKRGR